MSGLLAHRGILSKSALASFAAEVAADTPYLWWRMGEASGSALADSSGHSRTATLSGVPGTAYDRNEPGLIIDGSKSVEFKATGGYGKSNAAYSAATLATNMTLMAVVKINNAAAAGTILGLNDGGNPAGTTGSRDRVLGLDTAGKVRSAVYSGALRVITSAASINDGNTRILHLALGANDAAGTELYINGVSAGFSPYISADTAGTRHLFLGLLNMTGWGAGWSASATAYGFYQDVAIFPSRLSAARILAQAQAAGLA